jgi:hypothetical protein
VLLTATDYLPASVPTVGLQLAAIVGGAGLVWLYGSVARRRWGVAVPDVVRVVKRDLSAFQDHEATDYRLAFAPNAPTGDRLLHESLCALKWLGHLLIFAGFGSMLYQLMRVLGIVHLVSQLG